MRRDSCVQDECAETQQDHISHQGSHKALVFGQIYDFCSKKAIVSLDYSMIIINNQQNLHLWGYDNKRHEWS